MDWVFFLFYERDLLRLSTPSAGEPFRERKFDKSVSHPFLRKEADRSPNYPDSAHGIPKFTSIDGRSQVRSGFPGIEASSSMLQCKIPPLRAKSVHPSVNLPASNGQPQKQELDEKLARELDYLQGEARRVETAVATDWAFQDVLLFVEPHGAGKQWRWLLTSRLLNIAVSHGKFNVLTCATQKKMYFH